MLNLNCVLLLVAGTYCSSVLSASECNNTDIVNYIAQFLNVTYEVIKNPDSSSSRMTASITFTNTGSKTIPANNWEIYLSHIRDMQRPPYDADGTELNETGLKVYHVNGVLHRIAPTAAFRELKPGTVQEVPIDAADWMVSRTDVMPNWYVVEPGCRDARLISSTTGNSLDFVVPFTRPQQWKRHLTQDQYNPYKPQDRLALNADMGESAVRWKVIPTPLNMTVTGTSRTFNILQDGWVIIQPTNLSLHQEAEYLAEALELPIVSSNDTPPARRIIQLHLAELEQNYSYTLRVNSSTEHIAISGATGSSVFYGVQTLISLCFPDGELTELVVFDRPRYEYRGMHVDIARNFHSGVNDLKKLMDAMAAYKLNKLHLHLSDDEGWRLEIDGLEQLTTIAAKRCHDLTETTCIISQLGSGPISTSPGSGYYSAEEYRELLRYAARRHIQVIPEFDMPGHAHAAIAAMKARYRQTADMTYLLSDLNDTSRYRSVQSFTDNAVNPCINSTYEFINHVIQQLAILHQGIQNLTIFHFGGDEVPSDAWTNSTACNDLKSNLNKPNMTSADMKSYFVERVSEIGQQNGVDIFCWEDGVYAGGTMISRSSLKTQNVYTNAWNNVWEWGEMKRAYNLANAGYKVILSHATHLYFDFPYEPDPEERGYYWGTRLVPLNKTFFYRPDAVYDNIDYDVDRMGNVLNKTALCSNNQCPPLTEQGRANIIGMQGQLWSETVRQSAQFQYMVFPRLLALAERSWHRADWEHEGSNPQTMNEDWKLFTNILGYRELRRLDRLGIAYRVPPPGARINDKNELEVTSGLPGLPIRYSVNNGQSWSDYYTPVHLEPAQSVIVVVKSADGSRFSRQVSLTAPALTTPQPINAGQTIHTTNIYWIHIFLVILMLFYKTTNT